MVIILIIHLSCVHQGEQTDFYARNYGKSLEITLKH
jgi:hypothetical protein